MKVYTEKTFQKKLEKMTKCNFCDELFENESVLENHQISHHKNNCSVCSKTFSIKDSLLKHMKIHMDVHCTLQREKSF